MPNPASDCLESFGEDLCGEALALLREKAGLTQAALAKELSIDHRWICAWERASKRPPGRPSKVPPLTPARLLEIATHLGFSVDEVLRVLQVLRDLHPGKPHLSAGADPLAPSAMEERVLNLTTLQFDSLLRRHLRKKRLEQAMTAAAEKLEQLLSSDHPARLEAIRASRRFWDWSLSVLCCNESIRAARRDPVAARELAELAVAVANMVVLHWKDRLRAYALAHLANALRVAGRLDEAEKLFLEARSLWESAPEDPGILDPGRIYDLEASLRRDLRQYPEATLLLDLAEQLSYTPGRVALKKSTVLHMTGCYVEALAALDTADKLLVEKEPRDQWVLDHSRGQNLAHLLRFEEAAPFVQRAMELAEELGNRLDQTRSLWLQARVFAGRGERQAAIASYVIVRREMHSHRLFYDVALASHEQLLVHLESGEHAQVRTLASQLARYCEANIEKAEALDAIRHFLDAVDSGNIAVDLGRKVVAFLYRARHDESLKFAVRL